MEKRPESCDDTPPAEAGHEVVPTYHSPPNRHSRFAASAKTSYEKNNVTLLGNKEPNQTQNLSVPSVMPKENQLRLAHQICTAVNGPRLRDYTFYRERHSGRVQIGRRWNEEFEDTASREFEEVEPEEELRN